MYNDKESSFINRKRFSILLNEIGKNMINVKSNNNKWDKCFTKIIEYIEIHSPNALHNSENIEYGNSNGNSSRNKSDRRGRNKGSDSDSDDNDNDNDDNEILTLNKDSLDLEIYHIDADTLFHCINECEKCLGKNKCNQVIAAAEEEEELAQKQAIQNGMTNGSH